MEKAKELRIKYQKLRETLEKKKDENGLIPVKSQFIGSIQDFILLDNIDELSDKEIAEKYPIADIEHAIVAIDSYGVKPSKLKKFEFSLVAMMQLADLMNCKIENKEELLQIVYMTIFQRYNDDIKTDENYKVNSAFSNRVYNFQSEAIPANVKPRISSEKDIGCVYMTYEEYQNILQVWRAEYPTHQAKRDATKNRIVNYTLSNIRNRMMHGDFENKVDPQGNKIVEILPYGFKAKFFFDCIVEFYEAVAAEIKDKVRAKDTLFDLESLLLNKGGIDTSLLTDGDARMSLLLPLYVNSFLTYNFGNKTEYDKARKTFSKEGEKSEIKVAFLDAFYKSQSQDSFTYKVAEYNKNMFNREYTPAEIFIHFRNSVVHNNFKCENGMIYIKDYDRNGEESAKFVIPFEYMQELLEQQNELAKKYFGLVFPDAPNGNSNGVTKKEQNIREL